MLKALCIEYKTMYPHKEKKSDCKSDGITRSQLMRYKLELVAQLIQNYVDHRRLQESEKIVKIAEEKKEKNHYS